jgi:hypothetical protein
MFAIGVFVGTLGSACQDLRRRGPERAAGLA